ncbi:unnamed protein product [Anisakis simplex]|uniref:Gamma-glutamyltranspeptidase 1 n=1 Tax=Anisakis simplex TaxID=6269 RepID=A0A0M3JS63_ANISI|nr:unnamed protein product [Anisakis simplex]
MRTCHRGKNYFRRLTLGGKVSIHRVIAGVAVAVGLLLFLTTILFAILYFGTRREHVPEWPGSKNSLNGRYSTAAVASDNVLCSEIGRNILVQGGNAVDAAISVLLCLGVVHPMSSGLGGGHFMTIYNATTKTCHVVDARERAAAAAFQDMFKGQSEASQKGWRAMAVAGELHGLRTEYENFGGAIEWKKLFEPSIDLLNRGVQVSEALSVTMRAERDSILSEPTLNDFVNPKTKDIYKRGDILKGRTMLRDTLRFLSESKDPIKDFYNGWMTEQFAYEFQDNGGIITADDFRNYRSIVRKSDEIIRTNLSEYFVCGPPPPSSSAVTQSIIKVMDTLGPKYDQTTIQSNEQILHKYLEAGKFAYAMRSEFGDMDYIKNALAIAKNMTSDSWAKWVIDRIMERSQPTSYYGGHFAPKFDKGTTNIAVIDKDGNAVASTTTVNLLFGARVASESTGIIWNCQMDDFSLPDRPNFYGYPPAPANFIRPGKRPMSSISPLIFVNKTSNEVELAIGAAGGSTIITTVSTLATRILKMGWDLKSAMDAPRVHNQWLPNVTQYETNFPNAYVQALAERGHIMESVRAIGETTGIHKKGGLLYATCDFRKGAESQPAGY